MFCAECFRFGDRVALRIPSILGVKRLVQCTRQRGCFYKGCCIWKLTGKYCSSHAEVSVFCIVAIADTLGYGLVIYLSPYLPISLKGAEITLISSILGGVLAKTLTFTKFENSFHRRSKRGFSVSYYCINPGHLNTG